MLYRRCVWEVGKAATQLGMRLGDCIWGNREKRRSVVNLPDLKEKRKNILLSLLLHYFEYCVKLKFGNAARTKTACFKALSMLVHCELTTVVSLTVLIYVRIYSSCKSVWFV